MNINYLEHYGVPGMKWGRRKDKLLGSPVIELGPNEYRYKSNSSSGSKYGKAGDSRSNSSRSNSSRPSSSKTNSKTTNNKNPNNTNSGSSGTTSNKLDIKSAQTGLKESKKIVDASVKYLDNDRKKQTVKDLKQEAKNMTDDELRTVINRLNMEERYVSAMEREGVGRSKTDLQKTLELVGTAVTYADTALEIYDKIQKIRGR